eukprot:12928247-Prorocentrum_lima.AAC.1
MGRVFAMLVEKNHELNKDNTLRKFKGRVVLQRNNMRDENWDVAMFRELSSNPPTMATYKVAD